jgi:hypothetical protein
MSNPLGLARSGVALPLAALTQHDLFRTDDREELAHAQGNSLSNERVVDPIGVPTLENQSSVLEHAQVSRDRRSADREPRADLAGRELTGLEILEYLTPRWVGQSSEDACVIIHVSSLAILLRTIKPANQTTSCHIDCRCSFRWEVRRGAEVG